MKHLFNLSSSFTPSGDQPLAIDALNQAFLKDKESVQILSGVTGSGKTFTMANLIQKIGKPTLILSPNKTLVAQLYQEFKDFFPDNAVEYFVSYYDYYQPEAYIPQTDSYIEKDSSVNEEIEKLRLRATMSLMSRKDVIVLASVSCIYGLGSPKDYQSMMVEIKVGQIIERNELLKKMVDIYYSRNDLESKRGTFRVRGDVVEIRPAYDDFLIRIEMFGDEIEKISRCHLLTGKRITLLDIALIYPARHFVTKEANLSRIVREIKQELDQRERELLKQDKLVEAQRLRLRVNYDIEMLEEAGFCSGIENYSRIIGNLKPGSPPFTLLDFFGDDFFMILDESHATIPQLRAMYGGDYSRKTNLVNYGFRLPSALDNRPLNFEEYEKKMPTQSLFVSATPGDYELERCQGSFVEQLIRPTGLLDPMMEVRPLDNQMGDILEELQEQELRKEKTLILTLTKKSAEDLHDFLTSTEVKSYYIHSDTDTLKRTSIINQLRKGEIDVLVGINLLREGLDLPEVSLVVILDADKEGFLRNYRTLTQISGRAARNSNGKVLMYAHKTTESMQKVLDENQIRREKQKNYNEKNKIEPVTIIKAIRDEVKLKSDVTDLQLDNLKEEIKKEELDFKTLIQLEKQMLLLADNLEFEKAASLRDKIENLKKRNQK